jgi:hypothetical protein
MRARPKFLQIMPNDPKSCGSQITRPIKSTECELVHIRAGLNACFSVSVWIRENRLVDWHGSPGIFLLGASGSTVALACSNWVEVANSKALVARGARALDLLARAAFGWHQEPRCVLFAA